MNHLTVSARGAAALVATVAGAASYSHIADVATGAGERPWVAFALPLSVDGLIVVGVSALLEDRRAGRVPRMSARVAVAVGIAATLAANIASAEPTWTARAVAVTAPIAFLLAVEVLTRTGRPAPATPRPPATAAPPRPVANRPAARQTAAQRVNAARSVNPGASVAELSRLANVSRSTVRRTNGHPLVSGTPAGVS
jgi:hypothetical protein